MDKTWKKAERKVAKLFGSVRNPLSGINSKQTSADVIDEDFYVEVKYRKGFSYLQIIEDTEKKAKKEKKIPVLVLKVSKKHNEIFMIESNHIDEFCKMYLKRKGSDKNDSK